MRHQSDRFCILLVITLLPVLGCGGDPAQQLLRIGDATGDECPSGGIAVSIGADDNDDGTLDVAEVEQRQPVCDGEDGAKGEDGRDGADGEDGTPGTDNRVVAAYYCAAYFDTIGIAIVYQYRLLSSEDVFVSAEVADAYVGATAAQLHAASSQGAASGSVIVSLDYYGTASAGWWSFAFDPSSVVLVVSYHDFEMGGTGVWSQAQSPSICSVTVY